MSRTAEQWNAPPPFAAENYVDNRIYTDPDVYADEQERIFARVWKFCCHESELPRPGDFRTTIVAEKPILLIRGDDGGIRGFYNVCPHRGAQVVRQPAGNAKNFTCLFHHWTFDRAGECVSISMPDGYRQSGVDKASQGLREVRTELKYGLVFVNLDDGAGSLDDFVGEALEEAREPLTGVELEPFHFHRAVIDGNWKHWMETDREFYHTYLHVVNRSAGFGAEGYVDRGIAVYPGGHMAMLSMKYAYDKYSQSRRTKRTNAFPGLAESESRAIGIFPDFLINVRATALRIDCVIPLGADKTIVECRGFGLRGESAALRRMRINDHNEYWGPFGRNLPEDMLACTVQMKTMREGASPYSIYARTGLGAAGFDDEPMRDYYREWGKWMGRAAADPLVSRAEASG